MSAHPDFKTLEASRPKFPLTHFGITQTPNPNWVPGTGASSPSIGGKTISIDPYAPGRAPVENYKLLVSGIIPRPIGFVSTISKTGEHNLAPFSYFQIVNHDPPMFTLGFTSGQGTLKDTAQNLLDSKECTISIISENFVDAANYTSLDSPANVSEWALCGLTPVESDIVKPPRVGESVFSVEAKVIHTHDWHAKSTGNKSGTLVIAEGVRFHVKEDALKNGVIDPEKLKAVGRLGGITYSRVETLFELPRPHWKIEKEREEVKEALAK